MAQGVQTSVVIMPQMQFGTEPAQITCGNCQKTVVTTTTTANGACSYISVLITFLICCPLFWIPLCIDACKDVQHTCPSCGAYLGAHKRL